MISLILSMKKANFNLMLPPAPLLRTCNCRAWFCRTSDHWGSGGCGMDPDLTAPPPGLGVARWLVVGAGSDGALAGLIASPHDCTPP
jgi:hypothetical protein